jgi:hypothetical protein
MGEAQILLEKSACPLSYENSFKIPRPFKGTVKR